ncbi:MAG TPA: SDR family oxidoreductase [Candidatus Eremiobacteraceae bacterium]|jgi:NAD(P)-dependent dehydrogenase (short-subunit alcohol dehydrogenase family)
MEFKGKTALVTGASRGLGFELAQLLAQRGANLVIAARHKAALEAVAARCSRHTDVVALALDVSEGAEAIVDAGCRRFGGIDLLVNNASELGPSPMPPLASLPWRSLEHILRVNVTAPLHLTQLVLPSMRRNGAGTIVNVSSDAGVNAYPGWGGYGASKAALEHISRTLSAELEATGIRVIVVDPGDMDTQMHRDAEPGVDLSHLAEPRTVAAAILRLLEDDSIQSGRFEAQNLANAVH